MLINSVEKRLISDVPVSLLLSSGIDSSLVSYYASQINKNIDTYTVGFSNSLYDESEDGKRIANYFGLKNNTIMLDDKKLSKSCLIYLMHLMSHLLIHHKFQQCWYLMKFLNSLKFV